MTIELPEARAVIAAMAGYVPGRRADHARIAALASNESPFGPLPSVVSAATDAVLRANRYPDAAMAELREALAARFSVTADHIAVGPGSVGLIEQAFMAFCEPGDEVVFAWRSFEAYPLIADLIGAESVKVPLREDEHHDLDAMAAAINERTRIVFVCSPNNPTGTVVSHDDLTSFLDAVPSRVLVIVDEAYVEFAEEPADAVSLMADHRNMAVLRTFSKAYGLAGLRVGYAIAHPPIAEAIRRVGLPFAVSAPALAAAAASLRASAELAERVEAVAAGRERLAAVARRLGFPVPDCGGNSIWLRGRAAEVATMASAFNDADILTRTYSDDGVRISIGGEGDVDRVVAVLESLAQ